MRPSKRRFSFLTIALAIGGGAAIASLVTDNRAAFPDVALIAADDDATRTEALYGLVRHVNATGTPGAALIREIERVLMNAPTEPLLQAADALRVAGIWNWQTFHADLLLRELTMRAMTMDRTLMMNACETLATVPLDVPAEDVMPVFDLYIARVAHADATFREFDAVCGWAGPSRIDLVAVQLGRFNNPVYTRSLSLMSSCAASLALEEAPEPHFIMPAANPDHIELSRFFEAEVLAALTARRSLSRDRAIEQSEKWIRSFDDREKRAGALLAALIGDNEDLLRKAYRIEDRPDVRLTQACALAAMGVEIDRTDPDQFLRRALHDADGRPRIDALLCLVVRGKPAGLRAFIERPKTIDTMQILFRWWIIDVLVPEWTNYRMCCIAANESVDDWTILRSAFALTHRRLRFDDDARRFILEAAE